MWANLLMYWKELTDVIPPDVVLLVKRDVENTPPIVIGVVSLLLVAALLSLQRQRASLRSLKAKISQLEGQNVKCEASVRESMRIASDASRQAAESAGRAAELASDLRICKAQLEELRHRLEVVEKHRLVHQVTHFFKTFMHSGEPPRLPPPTPQN